VRSGAGRGPGRARGALPLTGLTAGRALGLTGLSAGGTLLVTGAGGGVGGLLLELAALRGLRTRRSPAGVWATETGTGYPQV
jgi:NADPH:quinone reductase-like Zn-dependent oxidoreductase